MYSSDDYIVAKENCEAYESVCDLVQQEKGAIVIYGPEQSGKTRLLTIGKEKGGKKALLCSAFSIMLYFDLNIGDEFFETLGEIPILFVDEIDAAATHQETSKLLELMITERSRRGLATCFASRKSPEEVGLHDLQSAMGGFKSIRVAPFGRDSFKQAVCFYESIFKTDGERALDDNAREYVAGSSRTLDEVKNKIRFLMQIVEAKEGLTFDVEMVKACIE